MKLLFSFGSLLLLGTCAFQQHGGYGDEECMTVWGVMVVG